MWEVEDDEDEGSCSYLLVLAGTLAYEEESEGSGC